jgi:hypothetical protein
MRTSREDRIELSQQHNQMARQDKIAQSYKDEYYGHGYECTSTDDDLRRLERNYGLEDEW